MHDGTPAHFNRSLQDIFSNTYHDQRISKIEPVACPQCLPDLNLLLVRTLTIKTIVFSVPLENKAVYHSQLPQDQ
jgi:hypothetical protein